MSLVLATLAGLVMVAPSAFAHHPIVSGVTSCLDDGRYQVTWTVANSESSAERYMLLRAFSVTSSPANQTGTTTGLVANGPYIGLVTASTPTAGTIVAPSGSVGGVTTTIPAGTASVTLNITGYWHYQYLQGGTNEVTQAASATVDLSKVCQGELDIAKTVTGGTAPSGTTFHVTYDNGKGKSGTVDIKNGETKSVTGLPFGSYTLAETGNPPNDTVTITPNPAIVNADHIKVAVSVTNTFPEPGGFTVTKHVTGETAGYMAGSTFTVHYVCNDASATTGDFTLQDSQTGTVSGLPVGTTCTLTETAKPPTTDSSYVYGTEAFVPSGTVLIVKNTQNNITAVALNNPITRVLGGFTATKHVTGETSGYTGGTFTVHYVCDDASATTGDLNLTDGSTAGKGSLLLGTACTLSETAKAPLKDASYAYGAASFTPSSSVTVNSSTTPVAVTLNNPITRVLGGFTATKHVTGETAGYVANSTFSVGYTCSDGSSGTLTLKDGETKSVGSLPLTTTCSLSETAKPATTDASYAYGTESWTPSNALTITSTITPVAITLTNPITRVLGGFSVIKHVTGETGGYVANSTFTVSYTCSNGSSGTLTVEDGETKGVGDLPLLTTCNLVESAKPATTDVSYAYGTETWTPSSTVTIASRDTVASVALTNPIARVLGGFSVTKHVTGETAGYVANSTFDVGYTCSYGSSGTLTLKDGETKGVGDLPLLTTCSLAETAKPATTDASYAYGAESFTPSSTLTVTGTTTPVAVTLTNPINRVLGGFTVTKHVTGETAGYTGGTLTVHYVCNDQSATSGDLTLTDGTTDGKGGLPLGTSCTLSETAKAPLKDASYAYRAETFSVNPVVVNSKTTPVAVALTNPIARVLGSFSVTKQVTGETAGYVANSLFTVAYTCSDGSTGTLTVKDGGTARVGSLPLLTTCNLVESAKPATTDVSYAYGTETWTPSSTVTIASRDTVASVTLTNPIARVLGSFSVTKRVTGAVAGYVTGSLFTVAYTCSDGSTGTLTLSNGSTTGITGLPVGTTCTLTESAKPATTGSTYAYQAESWIPSNVVTIATNSNANTVALTLTNPINNTPAQVLAAVVAQPALPVTGASNTMLLILVAGLLILAGGCFITAARLDD